MYFTVWMVITLFLSLKFKLTTLITHAHTVEYETEPIPLNRAFLIETEWWHSCFLKRLTMWAAPV